MVHCSSALLYCSTHGSSNVGRSVEDLGFVTLQVSHTPAHIAAAMGAAVMQGRDACADEQGLPALTSCLVLMCRCHSLISCRDNDTAKLVDHVADVSSALGEMDVCEDLSGDAEGFFGQKLSGDSRSISSAQEAVLDLAAPVLVITGELSP